jgi:GTP-dependent phosphoenolpyruvate carboxykinase
MEQTFKRPKSPPPIQSQTQNKRDTENNDDDNDDTESEEEIPLITTQQEFIKAVKHWVSLDNQLRIFNERIREARETKSILTQQIYQYTEDNNFTNPSIEISDGELIVCDKREYSSLSFSYIDKCLTKLIKDPAHVDKIIHTLKENREHYVVPDIRRIYKTQQKPNNS